MKNRSILYTLFYTLLSVHMVCLTVFSSSIQKSKVRTPTAANTNTYVSTLPSNKNSTRLNPKVLQLALKAYNCAEQQQLSKKPLLTIIDYSKASTDNRLWVIDVEKKTVIFNAMVAHGKGSGKKYAHIFSNKSHSKTSSLGLFLTGHTYTGKHGQSLRLSGLEPGFNNNAFERNVVIHSAWYVNKNFAKEHGYIGRSYGCLALNKKVTKPIIKKIKEGSLLFVYYPDSTWLRQSQFLHCNAHTA